MNYFELFEMPEQITFDAINLQKKYYELSRKYHPDFFTAGTDEEQDEALEKSSLLNKAFQTFKSVDKTIEYVLQQNNIIQDAEKQSLPTHFLMDMMEVNEALADAQMEENNEEIRKLKLKIELLQATLFQEVKSIITNYSIENKTNKNLLLLKDYYFKKKYLNRILEGLE